MKNRTKRNVFLRLLPAMGFAAVGTWRFVVEDVPPGWGLYSIVGVSIAAVFLQPFPFSTSEVGAFFLVVGFTVLLVVAMIEFTLGALRAGDNGKYIAGLVFASPLLAINLWALRRGCSRRKASRFNGAGLVNLDAATSRVENPTKRRA